MSANSSSINKQNSLISIELDSAIAIRNAISIWSDATTSTVSARREDILRDKQKAVLSFFASTKRELPEISSEDVKSWQKSLEKQSLAQTTIYYRLCHLSSFFEWVRKHPVIGAYLPFNPVKGAHPKAPKAFQTESVKALTDEECRALLTVVKNKADSGDLVGKRDYALLLIFIVTGMRRAEVLGLRGRDIELVNESLVVKSRVKGGDYIGREIIDTRVRIALLDYLTSCNRTSALSNDAPLWTRHDHAGRAGAPLTSHAFALNLKRYAKQAGIAKIHLHQTRHTFARMVSEDSGSITETQDALGHKNVATTRVYVQRISIRRDKHSERILKRFDS